MLKTSLKKTVLLFLALLFVSSVSAQDEVVSVTSESKWHQNKVNVAYMNKRISDAAEEYKEYAPIPRAAFYDIAFPKDKAEFDELNGYGLMLVSSVSQDETELPLTRVYATINGKIIELKLLKQFLSKESNTKSQSAKTFGTYRADAICLFPIYMRFQETDVLADFAKNRKAMIVASFDGKIPETITDLPNKKPLENKSVDEAIQRLMKREYPGFFDSK